MDKKYLIAGGDLRNITLAETLAENNTVYMLGFDKRVIESDKIISIESQEPLKEKFDYIVLPLVASNDGMTVNTPFSERIIKLSDLPRAVKEKGIVFGGMVSDGIRKIFSEYEIEVIDYSKREEFAVMNAVATGEGVIQAAMEETAVTLSEQKILIIGMGRIAKVIIHQLSGFGSDVTVAARKYHDLAWADIYNCRHIHLNDMDKTLCEYDLIINTVPSLILDEKKLMKVKHNSLIIDLASKPGGVDFIMAGELGLRAMWLLSLPGKVAPVTSGKIVAHTIENILAERGEGNG